ncbi:UMP phosphatase [Rhodobacteraceae bacterium THAF1]|uniref:TIGR01459 family HAD-type hydrolase n=1 Tax=Palleronia sp. THAF1 TaxID=2587842 RepID=UPI000F3D4EC2|nr:TIGR01459 family HAD-type hydrolase [Palleronia sp. THAF1]QFU09622.1 UMP phosphatase [Palleronia sp. THAF1]VDC17477.1 UMP phosphatase [Rhodobacteraceae bacterium THAF1]
MTQIVHSLSEISEQYDALFCDLWGCVHDGIKALPEAVAALQAFRAKGGMVVLLTNAPRPRADVAEQIAKFGVPDDAWDTIATSGDAARVALFTGALGQKVYHIGEPRDQGFFEPLNLVENPVAIEQVPLSQAEGIVCTGPFDPKANPDVLRPQLLEAKTRGLTMLNANPDMVVDRGDSREWCGGAVAQLYEQMGGAVLAFGKPHPPVYDMARRRLAEAGAASIPDERILAIGDGILTDVKGALLEKLDVLFVTGGLAAAETNVDGEPQPERLDAFLGREGFDPNYTIGMLR